MEHSSAKNQWIYQLCVFSRSEGGVLGLLRMKSTPNAMPELHDCGNKCSSKHRSKTNSQIWFKYDRKLHKTSQNIPTSIKTISIVEHLRYADDTVVITDSEEKLQNFLKTFIIESENKGLQLNAKKTECVVVSIQSDIHVCKFLCKGDRKKKQVGTFKYPGFQ